MKIALIGATGFVGSAVLDEALSRGHAVTALARDPSRLPARDGLVAVQADVLDAAQVAHAVEGLDAVVSAYNPGWDHPDLYNQFLAGSESILAGVRRSGVRRALVVGGAGSLYVAPGVQLVDTPAFLDHVPPNIVPGARAARDLLDRLRDDTTLDWTFLSPAPMLAPGQRSGRYELGGDDVPMRDGKPAAITVRDLAVAIVDELETPRHVRRRFTAYA